VSYTILSVQNAQFVILRVYRVNNLFPSFIIVIAIVTIIIIII